MAPRRRLALVAGTTGIVGYRLAQSLARRAGWDVIGIARKPPPQRSGFKFLSVDLADPDDTRQKLAPLPKITHVFFAAKYNPPHQHAPPEGDSIDINLAMLMNIVAALDRKGSPLAHVHLVHGNSYYGASNERRTPSREDDPRGSKHSFYHVQQDFITDRQKGKRWTWSISRPQGICDHYVHIARSIPLGVAVYASIAKAAGSPLCFPGRAEAYAVLQQCTDAAHLANAIHWIATNEACANQAFNTTNGDYFRWENLWARVAGFFDLEIGPRRETVLAKEMTERAHEWESLASSHGLRKTYSGDLVLWPYLDDIFAARRDQISNVTKLHRFGFHDIVDTEEMFIRFFKTYRRNRMIP